MRNQGMVVGNQGQVEFAVPVELAHGSVVRKMVRRLLETAEFPGDAVDDVILAVGEAFANAVAHGSGSRYEQVGITVRARRSSVSIQLRYPGEPFDVTPPAAPDLEQLTGRGRYLMMALMDAVEYDFPPGETIVRLGKRL
jgi:anti-sigma regulatory factor (Ser/Thr protein kinase)